MNCYCRIPNAVVIFLDLKAAYDTVPREVLWSQFPRTDDQHSLICLLRALFDSNAAQLVVGGQRSDDISATRGLLQGSSLSPVLFNLFIDSLVEEIVGKSTWL
jgi:hypothetical protein